jgi:predicted dehydrogenase
MAAVDGASLAWIVDASPDALERAGQLYPGVKRSVDVGEMLASSDCDAVIVTTNPDGHAALARRFMAAGKPLLVEKPLATDSETARSLVDEAERRNALVVSGHVYLFHPVTRAISWRIRRGSFGHVRFMTASRMFTRFGSALSVSDVDALWDLAPNDIAMFVHLAGGLPESVSAVSSAFFAPPQPDAYFAVLRWGSGAVAELRVSWDYPLRERFVGVVGSKESVLFDDDAAAKLVLHPGGPNGTERSGTPLEQGSDSCVIAQLRHFTHCVRSGKRSPVGFRFGYDIVRVLEAIKTAAFESRTVTIPSR